MEGSGRKPIAWGRACRPPFLPSVTSFSTIGRRSFALGSVVVICSSLLRAPARFMNIALRCAAVRWNFRPRLLWRMTKFLLAGLVRLFQPLGHLFDDCRRPARTFHPPVDAQA